MVATALSTDLYELTMMAGYHAAGLTIPATFELSVRALPPTRSFLVAAGLEQVLEYMETLRFRPGDIDYLRGLPNLQGVSPEFFDEYLPRFRFSGEVWAVPEGTPVFPPEPLLSVTAPLPEGSGEVGRSEVHRHRGDGRERPRQLTLHGGEVHLRRVPRADGRRGFRRRHVHGDIACRRS